MAQIEQQHSLDEGLFWDTSTLRAFGSHLLLLSKFLSLFMAVSRLSVFVVAIGGLLLHMFVYVMTCVGKIDTRTYTSEPSPLLLVAQCEEDNIITAWS